MAARDIFNVKSIREKKYRIVDLGPYNALFGNVEGNFTAMFYGESGSGKSVMAMQFADYYAKNIGKVLYNSHEESTRKTVQNRIVNFDINAERLYFGKELSFERMCAKIKANYYRLIIVDSVQYMNFTYAQLQELRAMFAKRHITLLMVSFGATKGNPDNARNLLHASDVKCFFKDGNVNVLSRYNDKPVNKKLFVPDGAPMQYPSLFQTSN